MDLYHIRRDRRRALFGFLNALNLYLIARLVLVLSEILGTCDDQFALREHFPVVTVNQQVAERHNFAWIGSDAYRPEHA